MSATARIKALLSRPRLIINSVLLAVFIADLLREFLNYLPKDISTLTLNNWAYTDWLIDYSQGFVRRGLSGEIWRLVPASIPPAAFVAVFSWILILVVAFGFLCMLARSLKTIHPLTMFGLLFLPSLFLFYLHDHNAIGRKEILGYVTLLLHLLVVEISFPLGDDSPGEGKLRRYVRGLLPISVILLPAIVLIHEGNFLLFVPLHGMLTLAVLRTNTGCGFKRDALWTGLLYLPAVLAFGAVYLSGTPSHETLLGICEKWLAAGAIREGSCILPPERLSGSPLPGSFTQMSWSLGQAVSITRTIVSVHLRKWLLILPTLGIALWYLVRQTLYSILRSRNPQSFSPQAARRYTAAFFGKYFCIPLLLSLPIYFVAFDYGRWFAVVCFNFVLVALSVNLPLREFRLWEKQASESPATADSPEYADHPLVFYGLSICICILTLVLRLPHCCLLECEIIRSPLQFFDPPYFAR